MNSVNTGSFSERLLSPGWWSVFYYSPVFTAPEKFFSLLKGMTPVDGVAASLEQDNAISCRSVGLTFDYLVKASIFFTAFSRLIPFPITGLKISPISFNLDTILEML